MFISKKELTMLKDLKQHVGELYRVLGIGLDDGSQRAIVDKSTCEKIDKTLVESGFFMPRKEGKTTEEMRERFEELEERLNDVEDELDGLEYADAGDIEELQEELQEELEELDFRVEILETKKK